MRAIYASLSRDTLRVSLDTNETLGSMSGPSVLTIPAQAGNKEYRALMDAVAAGGVTIGDYVAPEPPYLDEISNRQFFQQLALDGDITQAEALAAVRTGEIPAALRAAISTLTPAQQFNAEMLLAGATTYQFSNPLTMVLGLAMNRTEAEMKSLWRRAATLN
ncbi:hypothetical protein [uncultured Methylobacterium sp.]|jgi:hypothetical protein|uniref:hypothetical protein n=1 Tax=uncultured Methylobacterium sp. TaxID=157278 RepID=UPI00260EC76C|nr:hypothetical protein [uncultured Methylobacterium sp.]